MLFYHRVDKGYDEFAIITEKLWENKWDLFNNYNCKIDNNYNNNKTYNYKTFEGSLQPLNIWWIWALPRAGRQASTPLGLLTPTPCAEN